jgi:hypothetical protein
MPRPRSQPQLMQPAPVPAPVGGVNAVDAATAMPATDAVSLVNMVGGRLGLTSRLGYVEHADGLDSSVRTVIPFSGGDAGRDRLFIATASGIYDVTASGAAPVLMMSFGVQGDESGWGVFTAYVTLAGHFTVYADEANGLYLYTAATDSWSKYAEGTDPGQISGVNPANVAFVTTWKNRIWLVEKGTGNAYFLTAGLIAGAASRQSFGNKFRSGGFLVGLWNWTINGGDGIDDFLVAISSAGDVLVYKGTDPATPTSFGMQGSWFVGAVPRGRRIATDFGGDLLVLSLLGVIPMSRLVSGTIGPDVYTTRKIQSLFNEYASSRRDLQGWSIRLHPEDNALVINAPLLGRTYEQLAMSLQTQAWSVFRGVPLLSSEVWRGRLYFGTEDGRVCVSSGHYDAGEAIELSGLTSFQGLGAATKKRIQMIQPLLATDGSVPAYEVAARYDFNTAAISVDPGEPDSSGLPHWDEAVWDVATWPGLEATTGTYRGANGIGVYAAIAFKIKSTARTTLMGFNVMMDNGGAL